MSANYLIIKKRVRLTTAFRDLTAGIEAWRLWSKLAQQDLVARYQRSWLGPFWLVFSAAIFLIALSIVYSTLFHMEIAEYVPFLAMGILCWGFISGVAVEGVSTFVEAETYIRQVSVSLFIYVFRVLYRNILIFLHQFIVALFVLALFGKLRLTTVPLAVLGLFLLFLQAGWIISLLAIVGARFRDLPQIVTNVLQILFFITPIFWEPSLLGAKRWIADYNPLNSVISIIREPFLGHVPILDHYWLVLGTNAFGWLLIVVVYSRFSKRIVYWL